MRSTHVLGFASFALLLSLSLAPLAAAGGSHDRAATAFAELSTLVGEWEGKVRRWPPASRDLPPLRPAARYWSKPGRSRRGASR